MKSSLCALLLLAAAAPAMAQDYPAYDMNIEHAAIERIQRKLPELRSGYGISPELRLTVRDESKIPPLQRLMEMDRDKYRGRIFWL